MKGNLKERLASFVRRTYLGMVHCSIFYPAAMQTNLSMTEVRMNDYNIDHEDFARYVRDAERMRSEAMRELLVAMWTQVTRFGARISRLARSWNGRRKFNLSVPAPHR